MLFVSLALPQALQAQTAISGTVKEASGEPVIGGTIQIKGTGTGAVTDLNGAYQINAPQGAILIFSYVGFKSQEVTVGAATTLDIILESDSQLDQVVVVGYGTQNKRDITGSISQVKATDIMKTPSPSFDSALQGRAAGLQVTQSSGVPGSAVRMRIRGQSSISGSSDPLYIVDGVPVTSGDLSNRQNGANATNGNALADLNPNDIESVEVLKDAFAAAIYGARAANGVIIITTKQGKAGKTVFNAGYYHGTTQATL